MNELEIEIKYEVKNHLDLSRIIEMNNFTLVGEGREKNSYMDFKKYLTKRKSVFRLREYCSETIATHKKKGNKDKNGIKSRPEKNIILKTSLEDAIGLFYDLGAKEVGYYEKENRSTYHRNGYVICLDLIMDKGRPRYFVEVEGPLEKGVLMVVEEIELNKSKYEAKVATKSYFDMFAKSRKNSIF